LDSCYEGRYNRYCILPILVIFIPTPLAGKAVGAGAGLFVWITMWGVTDAVVQNVVYEYGMRAFEIVKQNNLGLAAIMYMPNAALKALSMAGMCRGSSVLLATVLTGTLIKFGGYAFTQMMGGMMGAVGAQGAIGAGKTMEPQQHAKEVSGLRAAPVTIANPYKFDPSTQQKAEAAIATSTMRGKIMGASMPGAKDAMALSTMSGLTGGAARGGEIEKQGLDTVVGAERTGVQARIGGAAGERQEVRRRTQDHLVGSDIMSQSQFDKAYQEDGSIALTDAQVEKYNEKYGTEFKGEGLYGSGISSDNKTTLTQTPEVSGVQSAHELTKGIGRGIDIGRAEGIGTLENAEKVGATGAAKNIADTEVRDLVGHENYGTALRLGGTKGVSGDLIVKEMLLDTGIVEDEKALGRARAGTGRIVLGRTQQGKFNEHFGTDFKSGTVMEFGRDSEGDLVLAQGKTGKEFIDMDRDQILHRSTHQTGADYKAGTKIDGADGIMDITPTAARARAEQGDPEVALKLGTGNEEQINRNTLQQARGMAEYLEKFASDKHTDIGAIIGKVYGSTDGKLGWEIPKWVKGITGAKGDVGMKAGIGVEGNEAWRREKTVNYLTTGLYQEMNTAGKEGGNEGIEMGLDKLEAADKFSSKIENEVLGKKPLSATPPLRTLKDKIKEMAGEKKPFQLGEDLSNTLSAFSELGTSGEANTPTDPTGGPGSEKTNSGQSEPYWHKVAGNFLRDGKEKNASQVKEETLISAGTTEGIARNVVGKDEIKPVSGDRQETTQETTSVAPDKREQVDTGKPGKGTVLGAGVAGIAGMVGKGKESQPASEQGTSDMAREVVGEDEDRPVSADSRRPATTDMGMAGREQARKDDLTVNFSRPDKKSQPNISEQEIAKELNIEEISEQDGSVGGRIEEKENETPKSPGGSMGAG